MLLSGKRLALLFTLLLGLVLGCPSAADAQSASHVRVLNFSSVHLLPPPIVASSPHRAASGPRSPAVQIGRRRHTNEEAKQEQGSVAAGENTESETSPTDYYGESEIQTITSLVPLQVTKNPFETESRVAVARLWGTNFELNFSAVTLRNSNVVAGPLTAGETLHPAPLARSTELFGLGLTIPLGHSAGADTPKNLWQSVTQVIRER